MRLTQLPAVDIVNGTNPVLTTATTAGAVSGGSGSGSSGVAPLMSLPKELWRLVDALWMGDALREKDLFAVDADPIEVRTSYCCTNTLFTIAAY